MVLLIIIHFSVSLRSFPPWHQNHRQFRPFYREFTVMLKNLRGAYFRCWGPYFRLAVFFPTCWKKVGALFPAGGIFSGYPFFRDPRKKELRKKDRKTIFALFSGVILSGGLFSFGLFSAAPGGF